MQFTLAQHTLNIMNMLHVVYARQDEREGFGDDTYILKDTADIFCVTRGMCTCIYMGCMNARISRDLLNE